jgi:hypothetical protein
MARGSSSIESRPCNTANLQGNDKKTRVALTRSAFLRPAFPARPSTPPAYTPPAYMPPVLFLLPMARMRTVGRIIPLPPLKYSMHRRAYAAVLGGVLLLAVAAYVRYYLRPCDGAFQILQVPLDRCRPEVLAEKRPLVLAERVVDHDDLLRTVFRWQHVRAVRDRVHPASGEHVASARFTLLFDAERDVDVDIAHPVAAQQAARVKLRRSQTLVLPPMWRYSVTAGCAQLRLYDPLFLLMSAFGG